MTTTPFIQTPTAQPVTLQGGCCLAPGQVICLRKNRHWPLAAGNTPQDLPDRLPDLELDLALANPDLAAEGSAVRHFRASRLIAQTVALALADAGLTPDDVCGTRTGFVSGSFYGCAEFLETLRAGLAAQGPRAIRPTDFAIATQGYPMAALTMILSATGPSTAFVCGPQSGQEALEFAKTMLHCDQAERMVVVQYDLLGPATRHHQDALGGTIPCESITALVLSREPAGRSADPQLMAALLGTHNERAACLANLAPESTPTRAEEALV